MDEVVILSLFRPEDAAALCEGDRNPEHQRWFEIPADFVPSLEHARQVLSRWDHERQAGTRFPFAIRAGDTDELLGGCELRPLDEETAGVSYWTYPAHRCRGVATRAVALVCRVAFELLGFTRLEVITDPDNAPSRGVALRNGFSESGWRNGRIRYLKEAAARQRA